MDRDCRARRSLWRIAAVYAARPAVPKLVRTRPGRRADRGRRSLVRGSRDRRGAATAGALSRSGFRLQFRFGFVLSEDLTDLTWFTVLAIAIILADIAARSQYRTTRPSAA